MEVQFGPNPVDEPKLLYKLQRKIKVFNTSNTLSNRGYGLVASSSNYGIVFIGSPDRTLSAYHLKELIDKECEARHFAIKLPETPTHIAVSCDGELLAATGGQLLCVYKVTEFVNVNVSPAITIKLDVNQSTFVSALQWNPCIPDNIAIAFFDGTLLVSSVSSSQVKKVQSKARCICWSPKGKQLVTGNSDGSLCQYKPDLTLAKNIPPPNLFNGAPVEALAIYWISTFQFAVVFRNAADDSRPSVTIVNTPKAGQPSCFNYEDICYSMGSIRPWYYYLQGLAQWNIILASSSNSMEIATLGSADGANWIQWCQTDEARPELPLTDKKQENYPVGICIDTCGIHELPWGENETLPHMPLLHVVSQSGLLTIFNVINLNIEGAQVCTPPQQLKLLNLPANAMTNDIPDDSPAQVTLPPPPSAAAPKSQPQQPPSQPMPTPQPVQPAFSTGGLSSMFGAKPFGGQPPPAYSAVPAPQPEPPKQAEVKPAVSVVQQQAPPPAQPKPQPVQASKPPPQPEVNAALKAEQERVNKLKADQELKNMLVKEVNDFQMELYKFVVTTREMQNKLQKDVNSIEANFNFQSMDTEKLKKDCDLEELRTTIVQLKLELVRACAVVAEARTHAEAKDLFQWTQVDPLTSKRVGSVKNLAYYVQTQLEQAHNSMDYKWNEMILRDSQCYKPGHRMIRPVLDDVYQPLVKQQEILSRQQAVLRTLRNTLKEVDATPMFKSTSLLRNTPFRNKDPLSKLTKNILNMSIEPQNKPKDSLLTPQKLDALRDMLSNHKPTKIKPVNVELRQHLAQIRISYAKSMQEKAAQESIQQEPVKSQPIVQQYKNPVISEPMAHYHKQPVQSEAMVQQYKQPIKVETKQPVAAAVKTAPMPSAPINNIKPDLIAKQGLPISIPSYTPSNQTSKPGFSNVVRTLFTDESNKQLTPPQVHVQTASDTKTQQPAFGFAPATSITASVNTRSILKDMLQNKQANNEAKKDATTFMGQKICSPSAFAFSTVSSATSQPPTISFTSKPISDINNMFNKFTPQTFAPDTKTQLAAPRKQSEETGEAVALEVKLVENRKEEIPVKIEQTKTAARIAGSTPVPDVLKLNIQTVAKAEKTVPKADKAPENSKENVPDKSVENVAPVLQKITEIEKADNSPKAFSFGTNKSATPLFGAAASVTTVTTASVIPGEHTKPVELKSENNTDIFKVKKPEALPISPNASSLFAEAHAKSPTAIKPQPVFGSPTVTPQPSLFSSPTSIQLSSPTTDTKTTKESTPTTSPSSASSLFASAASPTLAKTTQSGSIFSSPSTASSVFSSSPTSIFGGSTTAVQSPSSVFGTSAAQSIFSSEESKPSLFSTPTPAAVATPASVFASAAAATAVAAAAAQATTQSVFGSSSPSIFDSSATTTSSPVFASGTVFGSTATTTASVQSVFGSTVTTSTSQSIFGAATTTTQSVFGSGSSSSVFGSAPATTQSSVFGTPATTSQSVFGTSAATTQSSIFGGSPTTTSSSIFGSTTPTTQASVFGATTQASVFGSSAPATQTSVFGAATTSQTSVFGSPTQTTQASVFGSQPTTTASGSLFGGADNLFAAASISTTTAGSPTSGGSIFGGGSSGSVFGTGSNANVFGGKGAFSQSNPQAAAIFGGSSSFGQKPATDFWSGGGATGGTAFGSAGFGQQATTQASSIFGGTTGGSFSTPAGGQAFGSPQQTSVFGSPQQQTGSPAFGGSPVFGTKPAFGQPAGFGSPTGGTGFGGFGGFNKSPNTGFGAPAAFGGAPAFGGSAFGGSSPGKMFGGTAPAAPSFGTTQSNATFEQLATQNTLTFGNLAQQSPQQAQPSTSFNASPSFTGWRG